MANNAIGLRPIPNSRRLADFLATQSVDSQPTRVDARGVFLSVRGEEVYVERRLTGLAGLFQRIKIYCSSSYNKDLVAQRVNDLFMRSPRLQVSQNKRFIESLHNRINRHVFDGGDPSADLVRRNGNIQTLFESVIFSIDHANACREARNVLEAQQAFTPGEVREIETRGGVFFSELVRSYMDGEGRLEVEGFTQACHVLVTPRRWAAIRDRFEAKTPSGVKIRILQESAPEGLRINGNGQRDPDVVNQYNIRYVVGANDCFSEGELNRDAIAAATPLLRSDVSQWSQGIETRLETWNNRHRCAQMLTRDYAHFSPQFQERLFAELPEGFERGMDPRDYGFRQVIDRELTPEMSRAQLEDKVHQMFASEVARAILERAPRNEVGRVRLALSREGEPAGREFCNRLKNAICDHVELEGDLESQNAEAWVSGILNGAVERRDASREARESEISVRREECLACMNEECLGELQEKLGGRPPRAEDVKRAVCEELAEIQRLTDRTSDSSQREGAVQAMRLLERVFSEEEILPVVRCAFNEAGRDKNVASIGEMVELLSQPKYRDRSSTVLRHLVERTECYSRGEEVQSSSDAMSTEGSSDTEETGEELDPEVVAMRERQTRQNAVNEASRSAVLSELGALSTLLSADNCKTSLTNILRLIEERLEGAGLNQVWRDVQGQMGLKRDVSDASVETRVETAMSEKVGFFFGPSELDFTREAFSALETAVSQFDFSEMNRRSFLSEREEMAVYLPFLSTEWMLDYFRDEAHLNAMIASKELTPLSSILKDLQSEFQGAESLVEKVSILKNGCSATRFEDMWNGVRRQFGLDAVSGISAFTPQELLEGLRLIETDAEVSDQAVAEVLLVRVVECIALAKAIEPETEEEKFLRTDEALASYRTVFNEERLGQLFPSKGVFETLSSTGGDRVSPSAQLRRLKAELEQADTVEQMDRIIKGSLNPELRKELWEEAFNGVGADINQPVSHEVAPRLMQEMLRLVGQEIELQESIEPGRSVVGSSAREATSSEEDLWAVRRSLNTLHQLFPAQWSEVIQTAFSQLGATVDVSDVDAVMDAIPTGQAKRLQQILEGKQSALMAAQ